jgi:signal transduction histidine kinase
LTTDSLLIDESLAGIGALTGADLSREEFINQVLKLILAMGFDRARFWEVARDISSDGLIIVLAARLPEDSPGAAPGYNAVWKESDIARNDKGLFPVVTALKAGARPTRVEKDLDLGGRVRVEIPVTAGTETESVLACDWKGDEDWLSDADLRALRLVGSLIGSHLALEPLSMTCRTGSAKRSEPARAAAELVFTAAKELGEHIDSAITSVFAFSWPHQMLTKRREFVAPEFVPAAKRLGRLKESYPAGGPTLTGAAWRKPELQHVVSFPRLAESEVFVDKASLEWHTEVLGKIETVLYAVVGTLERRFLIRMMNRASQPDLPFLREANVLDAAIRDLRADVDAAISIQRLRSLQQISGLTAESADPGQIIDTIGGSLNAEGVDNFIAVCHQRGAPQFSFARSLGARCKGGSFDLDQRWEDDSLFKAAVGNPLNVAVLSEYAGRSDIAKRFADAGFKAVLGQPMEAGQTEGVLFIGLDAIPPRTHDKTRELPVDLGYGTTALIHAYSRLLANAVEMHHSQERVIGARRAYGLMGHEVRRPAAAVGSAGRSAIVASLRAAELVSDEQARETLTDRLNDLHTDLRSAERRLGSALRLAKLVARESEGTLRLRFKSARIFNALARAIDDVTLQAHEDTSAWRPYFTLNDAARNLGTLVCDEDYVEEVFKNILLNAVKYSLPRRFQPRMGRQPVRISINGVPQETLIAVQITNWGWPIPEGTRDVIFDPWVRGYVEQEAEALAGMGLGLFLARRLIIAHNGEILCSSRPTKDLFVPRAPDGSRGTRGVPGSRPDSIVIHATTFEIRIPRDLQSGVITHQWGHDTSATKSDQSGEA